MKLLISLAFILIGLFAPKLVANRQPSTWTIWFIRKLLPALCYGTAIGIALAFFVS